MNNWTVVPDKKTVIIHAFEVVKDEVQKFAEKLHLTRIAKNDNIITYARTVVTGGEPYSYYISAKLENNKVIIYDPDNERQLFEVKYILGYGCTIPDDFINEINDNKNYNTVCSEYFSRLEIMYLYYAVTGRLEDGFNKNCGYLNCSVHKKKRLDLIGDCIQQWKKVAQSSITDSVTVAWLCESVDDYVCVVYTDECTKLDEDGVPETNLIVITSNTITDEDNVDKYCANYLTTTPDYNWQMVLDLRLLHTMIYEELTSHSDENKDKGDEYMNKTDCEQGTVKHYEFDKKLFVSGDVYLITHSSSDTHYLSIFEMFDEDNRALFVSPHHYDYIMVDNILNGNVRIEKIIDSYDFLKNHRGQSPRLWGLKEVHTFEDTMFKIGAVYLITDMMYDCNPYFGVLRNKVLNPKDEAPYLEFMCAVSGDPVKIDIDEFISGFYSIKLVSTIEDFETK